MDSATEGAGGQGSCIEAPCRSGVCSTKVQDKLEVAATVSLLLLNNHGGVGDVGAPSLATWWSGKLVLWRNQSLDSRGQDSGARLASGAVSEVALANKRRRDASEMVFPNPSCPVGLAGTLHFFSWSAPRRPKGPVIGADLGRRVRRALSRATTPQGEVVGVNPSMSCSVPRRPSSSIPSGAGVRGHHGPSRLHADIQAGAEQRKLAGRMSLTKAAGLTIRSRSKRCADAGVGRASGERRGSGRGPCPLPTAQCRLPVVGPEPAGTESAPVLTHRATTTWTSPFLFWGGGVEILQRICVVVTTARLASLDHVLSRLPVSNNGVVGKPG